MKIYIGVVRRTTALAFIQGLIIYTWGLYTYLLNLARTGANDKYVYCSYRRLYKQRSEIGKVLITT